MRKLHVLLLSFSLFMAAAVNAAEKKPETFISGKIVLQKDLTAKAKDLHTLFIAVYDAANPAPMPYGALKISLDKDPSGTIQKFALTSENLMVMGSGPAPKIMNLKIKLPKAGGAGPDSPGDLIGTAKDVKLGTSDLVVTIDHAVP